MKYQHLQKITLVFYLTICFSFYALAQSLYGRGPLTQKESPFVFLENKGQIIDQNRSPRTDIDFRISSAGVNVFIGAGQIHYQWSKPILDSGKVSVDRWLGLPADDQHLVYDMYRMDVSLLGANKKAKLIKENKRDYFEHYYLPQCGPGGAMAYSYEKLIYKDIYPAIDWVLYVKNGQVEYDFVIHPGGKVSDIQLQYGGATSLKIEESGDFFSATPFGSVVEKAPYSFQEDGQEVASEFILKGNILTFNTATSYNGVLTIDPKLVWGTYYGDYCPMDQGNGVASVYNSTDVLFAGMAYCVTNIATTGAHQVNLAGFADAFLVKFNSAGTRLWATYYGGTSNDGQGAVVITDTLGNIYMAATTFSDSNIATQGSFKEQLTVSVNGSSDDFLVKFDSLGKRLWATYYGGEGIEGVALSIATDGLNLYLCGGTSSASGIATPGSHQSALRGNGSAYLVKFNGAGQRLWATYYGGDGYDRSNLYSALTCDKRGNIYMSGQASSISEIATTGSYQVNHGGFNDAFLVKFDTSGRRLWGTYFGGSGDDKSYSVVCDDSFNVYMAGTTKSASQIATVNSHQANYVGNEDVFLVKFDSSGNRQWSTYYGGSGDESYPVVVCNGGDKVFLLGTTSSTTHIATSGSWQSTYNGNSGGPSVLGDLFLAEFDASGVRRWGTYYGGPGIEGVNFALYDKDGYIYLAGATSSATGVATPGSHQDTYRAVVFMPLFAKFCVAAEGYTEAIITGRDTICANSDAIYTIPPIPDAESYIWLLPSGWTGSSDSNSININIGGAGGTIGLQVVRCSDTSSTRTYNVYVVPPDDPAITADEFELGVLGTYSNYQWLLNGQPIPGATGSNYTVKENGDYAVMVTNRWGCVDTSEVYPVTNYTGIEDFTILANSVGIYPNPSNDKVNIQSSIPVNVVLRTIEGRELLRKSKVRSIDISNFSAGLYILGIFTEEGVLLKTEKLLKQTK